MQGNKRIAAWFCRLQLVFEEVRVVSGKKAIIPTLYSAVATQAKNDKKGFDDGNRKGQ